LFLLKSFYANDKIIIPAITLDRRFFRQEVAVRSRMAIAIKIVAAASGLTIGWGNILTLWTGSN
jgi:hypothetical protein